MRCCAKFPSIDLPDQETDYQYFDTNPSICFHIYHLISRCLTHVRLPLTDKNICCKCKQYYASEKSTQIYTIKELVTMETTTYNFNTSFYIPAVQNLSFQITHVQIIGTN